ncbi:MAG: hypothetical protein IJG52_07670 [Lachnospiraceae bacterium]|nr:hypothetical protein [Lachnospiraceae bacterium]
MNNKKRAALGTALAVAAIAFLAVAVALSLSLKNPLIFRILSIPVSVFAVGGAVMLSRSLCWDGRKLAIREEPLPRELTACVLGVTRGLRMEGGREQYYVLCRYKDPVSGREATFTSEPMEKYPGKEIIGKEVRVHIDPQDESRYTIDLQDIL